jgi:hypothetical protein
MSQLRPECRRAVIVGVSEYDDRAVSTDHAGCQCYGALDTTRLYQSATMNPLGDNDINVGHRVEVRGNAAHQERKGRFICLTLDDARDRGQNRWILWHALMPSAQPVRARSCLFAAVRQRWPGDL